MVDFLLLLAGLRHRMVDPHLSARRRAGPWETCQLGLCLGDSSCLLAAIAPKMQSPLGGTLISSRFSAFKARVATARASASRLRRTSSSTPGLVHTHSGCLGDVVVVVVADSKGIQGNHSI